MSESVDQIQPCASEGSMRDEQPDVAIETLQKAQLEPGDVLVARVAYPIDMETANTIKKALTKAFPNNHAVVLDDAVLEVFHPPRADRPGGTVTDCWCGQPHDWENPPNGTEALRNLGHLILTAWRIPELAEWLNDKLTRWGRDA